MKKKKKLSKKLRCTDFRFHIISVASDLLYILEVFLSSIIQVRDDFHDGIKV